MSTLPIPEEFDRLSAENQRDYIRALRLRMEARLDQPEWSEDGLKAVLDERVQQLDDGAPRVPFDELLRRARTRVK